MAEANFNFNDNNDAFFIKVAESRFQDYSDAIIDKDLDIIPKIMDINKNRKIIHEYIKNLFICCTENELCNDSFKSICYTFLKDGFNLAMNMRMNR